MGDALERPYRALALVPSELESPEHAGPRKACPFCGLERSLAGPLSSATYLYVSDSSRACRGHGWFLRLLGFCGRRDAHLHQRCASCGACWIVGPKDPTVR